MRFFVGKMLLLLLAAGASAADSSETPQPEAVSPGELDRMVEMRDGCFGYSWSGVEGARGFELAVHRIDDAGVDAEIGASPALRVRVPATLSWTPSLEKCLAPGRYAWLVRGQTAAGWTDWSEPRLFEVRARAPGAPQPVAPEPGRPAPATSFGGSSPAIVQFQTTAGERLFTSAPQRLRPLTGAAFAPPSCNGGIFSDVTGADPNCAWIEQLAADEIAQPCEDNGIFGRRFCPDQPVTRGQIAGLLERAMRGTDTWRAEQGDGAVPNLPPALPGITPLDTQGHTGGTVGQHTSITIGADGLGLISYYDTGGVLTVAHCSNVNCTEATITPIDFAPFFTYYTAITIGADGFGLISYYDALYQDLKVAHCANVECTSVDAITSLDTEGNVGLDTSITIGADGLGLISYRQAPPDPNALKVAHCSNPQCTAATITQLATALEGSTSIAIGSDGLGVISYKSFWVGAFPYNYAGIGIAHCSNLECTARTSFGLDLHVHLDPVNDTGQYSSITIGADGFPLISYYNITGDLRVAHCETPQCLSHTITTLDSADAVGRYNAITIGADGLPVISYYDDTNQNLKIAHCSNASCAAATFSSLDTGGDVGQYSSITIGADGLPLISYYDATNGDLKVAHCSNVLCAPYFRRR